MMGTGRAREFDCPYHLSQLSAYHTTCKVVIVDISEVLC